MVHEVAASDLDITHIVSSLRTLLRRSALVVGDVESVAGSPGSRRSVRQKVRVALGWTLDLLFAKDFVQCLTARGGVLSSQEAGVAANHAESAMMLSGTGQER